MKKTKIIIWCSFLMSVILYALIIIPIKTQPVEGVVLNKNLFLTFGVIFAIIPHLIKKFNLLRLFFPLDMVMGEVPAILGLISYFIFSDKNLAFKLIGFSFVSILFLFPADNNNDKQ